MNEKEINLVEILKDVPKGTKFYCTPYGDVKFNGVSEEKDYPILFLCTSVWRPTFYWCYDNSEKAQDMPYSITDGSHWAQCIPYEGNEHLVGKTDMPKGGEK